MEARERDMDCERGRYYAALNTLYLKETVDGKRKEISGKLRSKPMIRGQFYGKNKKTDKLLFFLIAYEKI